jgi:hypothetical protein
VRLVAADALAVFAAQPVDQGVSGEEDARSGQEPEPDGAVAAGRVGCFLDELERDGADQHAAAERHHQAQGAIADSIAERDDTADDQ